MCTQATKKWTSVVSCVWFASDKPVKKRINMTLDSRLHAWACEYASRHGSNFSAYVAVLLKRERDGAGGDIRLTSDEKAELRKEVAEEVLATILKRKGGA